MNRIDVWTWAEGQIYPELKLVAQVNGIASARAVQRLFGPKTTFIMEAR